MMFHWILLCDITDLLMNMQILSLAYTNKYKGQKSLWFLVSARIASDPYVGIFSFLFLLQNDVQLQPKLLDRFQMTFFT